MLFLMDFSYLCVQLTITYDYGYNENDIEEKFSER